MEAASATQRNATGFTDRPERPQKALSPATEGMGRQVSRSMPLSALSVLIRAIAFAPASMEAFVPAWMSLKAGSFTMREADVDSRTSPPPYGSPRGGADAEFPTLFRAAVGTGEVQFQPVHAGILTGPGYGTPLSFVGSAAVEETHPSPRSGYRLLIAARSVSHSSVERMEASSMLVKPKIRVPSRKERIRGRTFFQAALRPG
jgi:hypothetical protein